jgi:hypothetical protein
MSIGGRHSLSESPTEFPATTRTFFFSDIRWPANSMTITDDTAVADVDDDRLSSIGDHADEGGSKIARSLAPNMSGVYDCFPRFVNSCTNSAVGRPPQVSGFRRA